MATTVARLEALLTADTKGFDRAMSASESRMKKVGAAAKIGLAVGVGAGIAVLKSSIGAAMDAEKAEMRLGQAFDSVKASADQRKAAQEAVNRVSKEAALDDEALSDVLANLTRSTGSVEKATEGMALAADIARGRNVSLEMSAKGVERVMLGQEGGLSRLGVRLGKNADATDVLRAAGEKYAGASERHGKTAAGAQDRVRVAVENLQEAIGQKLLPQLTPMINRFATGVEKTAAWVEGLQRLDASMERFGGLTGPNLIELLQRLDNWMGKLHLSNEDVIGDFVRLYNWGRKFVDVLKDMESWLDKLSGTDVLKIIPGVPQSGDPNDMIGQTQNTGGVVAGLWDEIALGRRMGLRLTSGRRPPRYPGDPSKHIVGKAIDMAGAPGNMARFALAADGRPGVEDVFYDPLGGRFRIGGHSDHVHVELFDQAGWKMLRKGWNMIGNFTGRPEPVFASGRRREAMGNTYIINLPNYVGSKSEFLSWLRNATRDWSRDNGKPIFFDPNSPYRLGLGH
jgi:hypothetical protein